MEDDSRSSLPGTLVVATGDDVGTTYAVGQEDSVIGRSLDTAIRVDGQGVSRYHARLSRNEYGLVVVSDLDSSNGTFVNGQRVEEAVLRNGDRLRLGPQYEFLFHYEAPTDRETLDINESEPEQANANLVAAARNLGRIHLASSEYAEAAEHLERALAELEIHQIAAPEDIGELLTDLAVCRLELGERDAARTLLERATTLLSHTSSAEKSLIRAKFIVARVMHHERPQPALALANSIVSGLPVSDPLRRDLEDWITLHTPT